MPTFNSNEFLSLPQQVSKNKKDIATLDTRVTNVEADVAENMAVPVIGTCQVLAFDTYLSLDIPSQSALGEIVIANHANYQRERLFGLTIRMSPNLVDDNNQFPVINGDVMYNVMFVMGARQLVNIATDEYHYVAIGTSIDKRFQIEWNFKHTDNTFTTAPDLLVSDIRTAGLNKLIISYAGAVSSVQIKWKKQLEHTFRGNLRILQNGFTIAEARISDADDTNRYATGYLAGPAVAVNMTIGVVKTADSVYDELYISMGGLSSYSSGMTVEVWADDSRELEQTTISDFYMYSGSSAVNNLNYTYAEIMLRTQSPVPTSNYADKSKVFEYIENIPNSGELLGVTMTLDGNSLTTNSTSGAYRRTDYSTGSPFTELEWAYFQAVCPTSTQLNNGSTLVITFPDEPKALAWYGSKSTGTHKLIYLTYTIIGSLFVGIATMRRTTNIITINVVGAITAPITMPTASPYGNFHITKINHQGQIILM